ncbi:traB domain-containing protein-like [Diadema antillarum]|uniref:traB domain-containing protein-like n=1 Tax=Diadema antillarum TaxID=105358 RepID=UPI003A89B378
MEEDASGKPVLLETSGNINDVHVPSINGDHEVTVRNDTDTSGTVPTKSVEESVDYNVNNLDASDGEGGAHEGSYQVNSDKESQGDSISDTGSYSPNTADLEDENAMLEQGTYRQIANADSRPAEDGARDADPVAGGNQDAQNELLEQIGSRDHCDDSESELGSYHINTDREDDDEDAGRYRDKEGLSDGEYDLSSNQESDVEESMDEVELLRMRTLCRQEHETEDLPETVTKLTTPSGAQIYIVGTAHFSENSQNDVAKTIQAVQPDIVMLELCRGRLSILELDEETLLDEAKNFNLAKLRQSIKQNGVIGGVMQALLLNLSAHLTKELGMAPGGEFRRAVREAHTVPGCKIHLGDRPIQITLKRAMASLSPWQKLRLAWYLLTSKEPITKEEVEKFKQKDLLEEMLGEMTGDFPALSQVFVFERDMYLSQSLKACSQTQPPSNDGFVYPAPVVVGVVGMGHVKGIVDSWETSVTAEALKEIITIPGPSIAGRLLKWGFRASLFSLLAWGCYRFSKWTYLSLW